MQQGDYRLYSPPQLPHVRFLTGDCQQNAYSKYAMKIAFLESELLNEYRVDRKDFRFFLVATSLVRNLSDDDLVAAIDLRQVGLPMPLIDKNIFLRNLQAYDEKIEHLVARMQQLDREAAFASTSATAKTKIDEMKTIAMHIGATEFEKYELSLRIPVDTRAYYSGISSILEEILDLSLKKAKLFMVSEMI